MGLRRDAHLGLRPSAERTSSSPRLVSFRSRAVLPPAGGRPSARARHQARRRLGLRRAWALPRPPKRLAIEEGGKTGGMRSAARIRRKNRRSRARPSGVCRPFGRAHVLSATRYSSGRDVRCSVCPAAEGCQPSAGHAGLSCALRTVGTESTVGGHRRPPASRSGPFPARAMGQVSLRINQRDKAGRLFFAIKRIQRVARE